MVAVAVADDDCVQVVNVQGQVRKSFFNDLDTPVIWIHTIQQYDPLFCLNYETAYNLISDK